jgi:DNA-binding NtrC family response regulator
MVGSSPIMQSVYRIIENVASSNAPVFITGESGTGKEVCAEAIHAAGARRNKPFIAMNCAAIPRELMESEIFGHVKGAFTGAIGPREGAAMAADGGTLFMDEICEMELPLQAKLLRFLQTFTITPVGTNRPQRVDVRIIAATNRNPMAEVEAGRFREDLYYRLHVVPLALPTLAERDDDVIEIARSFLIRYAKEEQKPFEAFSEEVEERLRRYSWPGNIRQLQNVVRNIVVLHSASVVTLDMLPPPLDSLKEELAVIGKIRPLKLLTRDSETTEAIKPLWQIERGAIEHAVDLCDGNIPRAAALLEVSPSTIYRKRMVWTSGNPSGEAQTAT